MNYSILAIQQLKLTAQKQNLSYCERFYNVSNEQLQQILNGYGPDGWSQEARAVLTWIYRNYESSAAIHDVRYEYSDGTQLHRQHADDEFEQNLKKQWRHRYGRSRWFNPVALYSYSKITTAYKTVQLFGGSSWNAAYERRKKL